MANKQDRQERVELSVVIRDERPADWDAITDVTAAGSRLSIVLPAMSVVVLEL